MEIRTMTEGDIERVLSITVAAFRDTALYRYVAPHEVEREAFLKSIFDYRLRSGAGHTETELAIKNGGVIGAATWMLPEDGQADNVSFTIGMHKLLATFPDSIQRKWGTFYSMLVEARDTNIQQPYWSLSPIVVAPELQGQGVASLLIRKKFQEIDTSNAACFLATQDAVNVSIYERFGFQTVHQSMPPESSLCSYTMIRR